MNTVTRIEIAEAVGGAFATGGAKREAILAEAVSAVAAGGNPAVIDHLGRLPNGYYRTMDELWIHLPMLPVGL